jgi:hypothetical protein
LPTLIGELWDSDGLWTVLIKPAKAERLLYAGSVLPSQTEIVHPGSGIARYQKPARPEAGSAEDATSEPQRVGPKLAG